MVIIDYVLILVVALSGAISLFRGFFKEAVSLASWIVALWLAWRYGLQLAQYMDPWLGSAVLRLWVARAIIVIGGLIAGGIAGWLVGIVIDSTGLTGTDRAIGSVFGVLRGVLLAGLLLTVLDLMGFQESAWWHESKLIPYAAPVAEVIRHAAEDGLEYIDELNVGVKDGG